MKKEEINWGNVNLDFTVTTKREQWLIKIFKEYKEMSIPKCSCGKIATTQTARGESEEESFSLPRNYGWYCGECWKKGVEIEEEAMYGN